MKVYEELLLKFQDQKVVVVGDVMLDKYLEGEVKRINVEAPVPIVNLKREFFELGGAANVAANIVNLGGRASLFGFVGRDPGGETIKKLLREKKIDFFLDENSMTTEKTRVIGENQQLLRYDKEETSEKLFSAEIKNALLKEVKEAKIIIISDYAKGTITKDLMNLLSDSKKKIIVDPKPKNRDLYKEVFLIKFNERESLLMSSCKNISDAGNYLKENLNANVIITRGAEGMSLFLGERIDIPTYAKEVYDITGAGDTAIATLALAFASGSQIIEAAILANHAASIAVSKKGTKTVGLDELKSKISSEAGKIVSFNELIEKVSDLKRKGKKIVWTNGCFDFLHIGHIRYLREAKKLGDALIVGINSDESVRKLKGEGRPIQAENERAEILASLEFVNYIIIFPELTVNKYLAEFKPEIYVKGGDYSIETINKEEKKVIEVCGGEIKFIPLTEGKSTSGIIRKIAEWTETNKNILN